MEMYLKDSMCEGTSDLLSALTMGPACRADQTALAFLLCIQTNFIKDRDYSQRKHCRSHWSRTQKSLIIKKECKNDRIRRGDLWNKTVVVLKIKASYYLCTLNLTHVFTEWILHINVPDVLYEVNINCIININIYN